ncbi:hypothetical protein [Streptomyces diacarni]|uniref:hypothetical protein n=1 Tax=Streptomyces diacarni TaxID=2800381 RepID=UPI0015F01386|nr:hypothetical protein [Streptomyces diacarni]
MPPPVTHPAPGQTRPLRTGPSVHNVTTRNGEDGEGGEGGEDGEGGRDGEAEPPP